MKFFNPFTRRAVAVVTFLTTTALIFATDSIAQDIPYKDDRSGPKVLIQSYYNAINNHDYPRAYSYWHDPNTDFETWSKGFATTKYVSVIFGPTYDDPGAGSNYWALPVAISSLGTDGKVTIYSGCYSISRVQPDDIDTPPYRPTSILSGHLTETSKPFQAAVPIYSRGENCPGS